MKYLNLKMLLSTSMLVSLGNFSGQATDAYNKIVDLQNQLAGLLGGSEGFRSTPANSIEKANLVHSVITLAFSSKDNSSEPLRSLLGRSSTILSQAEKKTLRSHYQVVVVLYLAAQESLKKENPYEIPEEVVSQMTTISWSSIEGIDTELAASFPQLTKEQVETILSQYNFPGVITFIKENSGQKLDSRVALRYTQAQLGQIDDAPMISALVPSPLRSRANGAPPPPPPPRGTGVVPPPPPPPRPVGQDSPKLTRAHNPSSPDPRTQLLEGIRGGVQLKAAGQSRDPNSRNLDAREQLMESIRSGVKLKTAGQSSGRKPRNLDAREQLMESIQKADIALNQIDRGLKQVKLGITKALKSLSISKGKFLHDNIVRGSNKNHTLEERVQIARQGIEDLVNYLKRFGLEGRDKVTDNVEIMKNLAELSGIVGREIDLTGDDMQKILSSLEGIKKLLEDPMNFVDYFSQLEPDDSYSAELRSLQFNKRLMDRQKPITSSDDSDWN